MTEFDRIFQDYDFSQKCENKPCLNFLQNSGFSSESQYLDQFFEIGVLGHSKQTSPDLIQTQTNLDKIKDIEIEETQKNGQRTKSKFHNYQKHLIITLRKTVNLKCFEDKQSGAVKELWSSFCGSKIYNKSLLRIVFGEKNMGKQVKINTKLFQKEGFKQVIQKYCLEDVIEAQLSLRKVVLEHFEQFPIEKLLESRKLPVETKQLLKKYVEQFIFELKEGNVMKRLPKDRKREIVKKMGEEREEMKKNEKKIEQKGI